MNTGQIVATSFGGAATLAAIANHLKTKSSYNKLANAVESAKAKGLLTPEESEGMGQWLYEKSGTSQFNLNQHLEVSRTTNELNKRLQQADESGRVAKRVRWADELEKVAEAGDTAHSQCNPICVTQPHLPACVGCWEFVDDIISEAVQMSHMLPCPQDPQDCGSSLMCHVACMTMDAQ